MNKEQILHYLKGGKFRTIYSPKSSDTRDYHKKGRVIEVWQNCLNTPISDNEYPNRNWEGQYRFNSDDIYGWFPEEDIEDIIIIDEFIEYPEPTRKYCYRLTYTEEKQLLPNFGKGNWNLPLTVYREYDSESDDYIRKLSNPQATKIERRIIDMLTDNTPDWQELKLNI